MDATDRRGERPVALFSPVNFICSQRPRCCRSFSRLLVGYTDFALTPVFPLGPPASQSAPLPLLAPPCASPAPAPQSSRFRPCHPSCSNKDGEKWTSFGRIAQHLKILPSG